MLGDVDGRAGGDGGVVGSALGHGDGGTLSGGTATSGARAAPTWQMAAADADADADADLAELARQKAAAEARAETAEARARWAEDRTADAEDADMPCSASSIVLVCASPSLVPLAPAP